MRGPRHLFLLALLTALTLSGCATTQPHHTQSDQDWLAPILGYEASLREDHPDHIVNLFQVAPDIKAFVRSKFTQSNQHKRAKALANWLVEEDGHGMSYDLTANLSPVQAFDQQRGNCLSFTILLVSLAHELGIELQYNDVDLPSTWDATETGSLILYRHVNAIFKSPTHKQIFDLAMGDYDQAFPQRIVTQRSAGAMLHANLGVDALNKKAVTQAFHHLKLATSIDPKNADHWINLGALYKRTGDYLMAERLFKTAYKIDDSNSLAASNLERLYSSLGKESLAKKYQKRSAKARAKNPYVQFHKANAHYDNDELKLAFKAIKRAIKLHDQDSTFFELRSRLHQHFKQDIMAIHDLKTAYDLANNANDRGRYFNKVKRVAKRIEQESKGLRR